MVRARAPSPSGPASTSPPSSTYFGSKEGLYRAVVEEFAREIRAAVGPTAERIATELASGHPSRRQLVGLLCDMVDVVIAHILDDSPPNRESRQKFFARMEVEPNAAVAALQDEMVRHVCAPCCALIARLTGRQPDDEQVLLRAMTIIGQAKIFCSWGTSRILRWDSIGEARVRAAQAVVRRHIEAIFYLHRGGKP